jgi:hypothetical protein
MARLLPGYGIASMVWYSTFRKLKKLKKITGRMNNRFV